MARSSDPKYQIKIIKAGIGDPLLGVSFEFTNTDGTFWIPNPDEPLDSLNFQVTVSFESNSGEGGGATVGNIDFGALKGVGPYNCDIPFDNLSGFTDGDTLNAKIVGGTAGAYLEFSGPGGSTNVWQNDLTYSAEPVLFADLNVLYGYFPS